MNDAELQRTLDADAILKRKLLGLDEKPKKQDPVDEREFISIPPPVTPQAQQIPSCASGLVVTDIRIPWNSVARLVFQVVVVWVLVMSAIGFLILSIWACRLF